jgi:hypothetical protein
MLEKFSLGELVEEFTDRQESMSDLAQFFSKCMLNMLGSEVSSIENIPFCLIIIEGIFKIIYKIA